MSPCAHRSEGRGLPTLASASWVDSRYQPTDPLLPRRSGRLEIRVGDSQAPQKRPLIRG